LSGEHLLNAGIGKVTLGLDWGLTNNGTFSPEAIYFLQTDDGANIMVTEAGHAPNVQILFETGSPKYAWLNSVTALANGAPFEGGVSLNIWQVSVPMPAIVSIVTKGHIC
jgi:hypothetical protein